MGYGKGVWQTPFCLGNPHQHRKGVWQFWPLRNGTGEFYHRGRYADTPTCLGGSESGALETTERCPWGVRALEGATGRVEPLECNGGPFLPSCGLVALVLGPLDICRSVGGLGEHWKALDKKSPRALEAHWGEVRGYLGCVRGYHSGWDGRKAGAAGRMGLGSWGRGSVVPSPREEEHRRVE